MNVDVITLERTWVFMRIAISMFFILLAIANFGCNNQTEKVKMAGIDLATYSIDGVAIGDSMPTFDLNRTGVEIGADDQTLDSLFVTLDEYQGELLRSGKTVAITTGVSPAKIEQLVGKPYWQDLSDGELIMFYEYRSGEIEIQFEFPDSKSLAYITIAKNGVLSDPDQRTSYGVDKPWPPAE